MSKAKRQAYGEGAVYQRARDGRWVATIEAGWNANGGRRRITLTGKTETEAKRKLRDKKVELARAEGASPGTRLTVKAWSDEWLRIQERSVRPSTFTTDRGAVRRWVVPAIGTRRLGDLAPRDVRLVVDAVRSAGLEPSTALRTQRVLIKMLRDAVAEGHHVPSTIFTMKAPSAGANDREAFELEDALAVLTKATELPDRSKWAAMFLQGLRQGERLGLLEDCLDFDRHLIRVEWQLQSLPYVDLKDKKRGFRVPDGYDVRHLDGALHLVRPKTRKGYRVIPMVPWFETAVQEWLAQCAYPTPHGLVWRRPDGRPIPKNEDTEQWYELQRSAEVRHPGGRLYKGHEARHTTASLLNEAGVDLVTIQAILGHSSYAASKIYIHASQERAREAMEGIAARLRLELPAVG